MENVIKGGMKGGRAGIGMGDEERREKRKIIRRIYS
jgi:hypothetical protein